MAESHSDKTLPATARRIEQAREEGQVARSRDLGHFAAFGPGFALLGAFAPECTAWLARMLGEGLRLDAALLRSTEAMTERLAMLGGWLLLALLPVGAVAMALTFGAGALAGGWNFTWKPLAPKLEKIGPIAGFRRLFSVGSLGNTLQACLLALVLGTAGALYLHAHHADAARLLAMPLPQALAAAGALLQGGLWLLGAVCAAFALVDVPLQRQLLLRRLRMNVEEMKKEMRDVEGNAEVKSKLKLRMREVVGRRMLAQVPRADLVVMNPTHYAVALRYDEAKMAAPRVVAKGSDLLALRIRDLAQEHRVPVLQAAPLARALYAHCGLDDEVPARLFSAVAQVLAWVYQLREAVAAGRAFAAPAPLPPVPADMDPLADRPATAAGAGA
jgi:flagellar biosynthetic protein FlhB